MADEKRIVSGNGMGLVVVEDADYNLSLARIDKTPARLYMVQLREGVQTTTHYALAESEKGAILQCSHNEPGEKPVGTAIRLPLHIRGWSHTEF